MAKTFKILLIIVVALGLLAGLAWWYLHGRPSGRVATGMVQDPISNLQSVSGRTNVLLLGVGGKDHEGGDLTDSMIVMSYDHATGKAFLISIPRDIWVPSLKAKINSAYHYGNDRNPQAGLSFVKADVGEVIGQPIQYAVILDFQGFEKMIDAVGGVDITVDTAFDDYLYPIAGKEDAEPESARYEHLHFDAGLQHMDGATALKFARSRHSVGDEGTDFARSKRQQKVIVAFKNKLLSSSTLFSASTLQNLLNGAKDTLVTDASDIETGAFIRLFLTYAKSGATPTTISLVDLFINPKDTTPYAGQWVLIPKTNIGDIHDYVAKAFTEQ